MASKIARDMVAYLLVLTGHSLAADDARSLVSEVVGNVYLHTTTRIIHIDVTVKPAHVSVAVWDDAPERRPRPADFALDDERGRGLFLVEALSTAWGVSWPEAPGSRGKRVWFSLDERNRVEVAA